MLTKRFFAEIFLTFGIIFILINLMMKFNYGNFNDTQYFGISTLFEMLNPANASSQNLITNIDAYMKWVNTAIPEFTKSLNEFRSTIFGTQDVISLYLDTNSFQLFNGIWAIFKALTYVVQFIGVIGMYMVLVLMYVAYLIEAFSLLISGNWVSVKPTAYWSYPQVVHGLTLVYTI